MPNGQKYELENDLLINRFWGHIVYEDFVKSSESLMENTFLSQETKELVDLIEVESFDMASDKMHDVVKLNMRFQLKHPDFKTAIVAPSPLAYGMARMYQNIIEVGFNIRASIEIFKSLEEAKAWLEVD